MVAKHVQLQLKSIKSLNNKGPNERPFKINSYMNIDHVSHGILITIKIRAIR